MEKKKQSQLLLELMRNIVRQIGSKEKKKCNHEARRERREKKGYRTVTVQAHIAFQRTSGGLGCSLSLSRTISFCPAQDRSSRVKRINENLRHYCMHGPRLEVQFGSMNAPISVDCKRGRLWIINYAS